MRRKTKGLGTNIDYNIISYLFPTGFACVYSLFQLQPVQLDNLACFIALSQIKQLTLSTKSSTHL